jgi:P27 family predicted phage terminase small subunit
VRGRKPKPTLLADLHGRPSKTKPPPHEPKPVTGDLAEPPAWLSETQQDGWRYAIQHAPPGLLKRIDHGALLVWVVAEDLHRQATRAQARTGLVVKLPSGVPMQSPYLPIINRQGLIMLKAASELGFSPVSRPRIGMIAALPPSHAESPHASTPTQSLAGFLAARPAATQH